MNATHILEKIPVNIQRRYNINKTVRVEADNKVFGGHFTLINKAGEEVSVDAVELSGTKITVRTLQKK